MATGDGWKVECVTQEQADRLAKKPGWVSSDSYRNGGWGSYAPRVRGEVGSLAGHRYVVLDKKA